MPKVNIYVLLLRRSLYLHKILYKIERLKNATILTSILHKGEYLMTKVDLPKFDEFLVPIIRYSLGGKEHELTETIEEMSKEFNLSEEQCNLLMPSGQRTYIYDRVAWAITYLVQAGLLVRTGRSRYVISDLGRQEARNMPEKIKWTYLEKFPAFKEFKTIKNKRSKNNPNDNSEMIDKYKNSEDTPNEEIDKIFEKRNRLLENDLLDTLIKVKPADFEKIIIDVVLSLGYGKDYEEMAKVLGQPNDQGIDGEISQDKLGFDKIYLQAKRWGRDHTVGSHEIRDFIGALAAKKTKKGIFITTAKFSKEAIEAAKNASEYIVKLIDGIDLASLMIDNMVGIREVQKYSLKEIDKDYFESF